MIGFVADLIGARRSHKRLRLFDAISLFNREYISQIRERDGYWRATAFYIAIIHGNSRPGAGN